MYITVHVVATKAIGVGEELFADYRFKGDKDSFAAEGGTAARSSAEEEKEEVSTNPERRAAAKGKGKAKAGGASERNITTLVGMGFQREDAAHALVGSGNDVQWAANRLFDGGVGDGGDGGNGKGCVVCNEHTDEHKLLICDGCNGEYHLACLRPALTTVPEENWFCRSCSNGGGERSSARTKTSPTHPLLLSHRIMR